MRALRWLAVPLLSLSAACAWWMAGRPGLDKLDRIIFSHELHEENGIDCSTCHAGVAEATTTEQAFLPREATCLDCHEKEENCAMCHRNVKQRRIGPLEEPRLEFSHEYHLAMSGVTCETCHANVQASNQLPVELPEMAICLDCHHHDQQYAQARCLPCHPDLRSQPLKAVAEYSHTGRWMERHGIQSRSQGAGCLQCHRQTRCAECHSRLAPAVDAKLYPERVGDPQLHRGDWISTHAIEARADPDACLRCHRVQSYCEECHRANGLTAQAQNGRVPHPRGYAAPGGPAFHGDDARSNISTCAACHDQGAASNCIECHQVGGIGGNPHPPGWDRDDGDRSTSPACAPCHGGS